MRGKLRVLRAQKCIALVGAENPLTSAGPKNSTLHGGRYGIENGKMQNFVHPNYHATVFALKQWLQRGKLRVLRAQKCIALVGAENPLTCAGPINSPLHGGRYGIENYKM